MVKDEVHREYKAEDMRMCQKPRDYGEMSVRNGPPIAMNRDRKAEW